jgi:hypothetical protein
VLVLAAALSGIGVASASAAATKPPGYHVVTGQPIPLPPTSVVTGHVDCPTGTVIWGGGVAGRAPLANGQNINTSAPGGKHKGWNIRYNNASAQSGSVAFNAICAKKPAAYGVRSASVDLPGRSQAVATATCPKGTVLFDGGISTTANSPNAFVLSAYPQGTTAYSGTIWNGSTTDAALTATAICGAKPLHYKVVTSTAADDTPGPVTIVTAAQCPDGTAILGGGSSVQSARPAVSVAASLLDSGSEWLVETINAGIQGVGLTTYAICAA